MGFGEYLIVIRVVATVTVYGMEVMTGAKLASPP